MLEEFGDAVVEYGGDGYMMWLNEVKSRGELRRLLSKVINMGFRLTDATDEYLIFNRGGEYIIISYVIKGSGIIVRGIRYIVKEGLK